MRSVVEIGASVPAFLGKLWKMVNDTETNHLISWSPSGKTFVIKNQADIARELLPLYYKHNNMASFIRQLNMYGFHKITSVENGGLRYEKDEIEFSHPCFMKGHAYLLEHIKRKIANPKSIVTSNENGEKVLLKPELMNKVLTDVKQMKGKQESLDAKFSAMKQENEALWREVAILRQKHIKQQQIVNNLIQFLMSLVQPTRPPNASGNNVGVKRPYQLMINSAAHNSGTDGSYPGRLKNMKLDKDANLEELSEDNLEDGPTIHELAHDDILHNENNQEPISAADYITVDMPNMTNPTTSRSPADPASSMYHVTMEDGEDNETGASRLVYPIITSASPTPVTSTLDQTTTEQVANNVMGSPLPVVIKIEGHNIPSNSKARNNVGNRSTVTSSSKSLLSPENYNTINPSADLKLPAEIFASDDSVSDAGVVAAEDINMQNALQELVDESLITSSKDKMLGGINIKLERLADAQRSKKEKAKKGNKAAENNTLNLADIKTELQDDFDWNNMTLATVNNNTNVNRFQSRHDIDDHLESMQTDLESLRDLLRSDSYAFDTNTLLGSADARLLPTMSLAIPTCQPTTNNYLFGSDDPFYGLPYNAMDDRAKSAASNAKKQKGEISNVSGDDSRVQNLFSEDTVEGNQLISYTGNIPDFEDISIPDLECDNSQEPCVSPSSSTLNTPQMQIRSPSFTLKP
ncbi:heat shock factor protein isoform X2 [Trichoplusia ni]|uniref:Heat shock factor protein isoform X2 n=1 Tax=Trichoplusia ni TaxID=7111 RepID=A0A7E5VVA3_TRINI|nr:heat shock factor protein isoform X2 [Trichoplusia ni]